METDTETTRQSFESFRHRSVLVSGGAGFIGSHLADRLLSLGARVRILDDLSTGLRSNLDEIRASAPAGAEPEVLEGDLRSRDDCRRACAGVDIVFHQAALGSVPRSMEDPATTVAVNVTGTANLLTAARDADVKRFVYASSSSVYGDSETLPKREGEEGRVLSPYAASKAMCEQLADVFSRAFGLETVGLRYFNVYGPRQRPDGPYAAVIPRFLAAYLSGKAPVIFGDGGQSRDFTWVGDAVTGNLLAALAPAEACGRAYNVAGGRRVTLLELADAVRTAVGGGPEPEHGPARAGDVRHSLADLSRVTEKLGYGTGMPLAEGLSLTVATFSEVHGAASGLGHGTASR